MTFLNGSAILDCRKDVVRMADNLDLFIITDGAPARAVLLRPGFYA